MKDISFHGLERKNKQKNKKKEQKQTHKTKKKKQKLEKFTTPTILMKI